MSRRVRKYKNKVGFYKGDALTGRFWVRPSFEPQDTIVGVFENTINFWRKSDSVKIYSYTTNLSGTFPRLIFDSDYDLYHIGLASSPTAGTIKALTFVNGEYVPKFTTTLFDNYTPGFVVYGPYVVYFGERLRAYNRTDGTLAITGNTQFFSGAARSLSSGIFTDNSNNQIERLAAGCNRITLSGQTFSLEIYDSLTSAPVRIDTGQDSATVKVDSLGGIYVGGSVGNANNLRYYDTNGILQWTNTVPVSVTGIGLDSQGYIYVTTVRYSLGTEFVTLTKYSSDGQTIIWTRDHGATLNTVRIDTDDSIYVAGSAGTNSATVRKYSTDGTLIWSIAESTSIRSIAVKP
jgi:hypothetical protein